VIGRRTQVVVLAALAAVGCVRAYPQPAIDEPHADVQIRVVHHQELGPQWDESVRIAGYGVALTGTQPGVRQATLRVRPEPAEWLFQTDFFHPVTTWQTQTYWQTQSYLCGSSRYGPQYCSRSIPMTRTVPITVHVPDGGCGTSMVQTPLAGAVYLVQYELVANGVCRASCQRLLEGPGGALVATECGANEPIPDTVVPPAAVIDAPLSGTPSSSEFPDEPTSGGEVTVPAPPPSSTSSSPASILGTPR
jgi:hypothetical protein